jgi:hypothetical protein
LNGVHTMCNLTTMIAHYDLRVCSVPHAVALLAFRTSEISASVSFA